MCATDKQVWDVLLPNSRWVCVYVECFVRCTVDVVATWQVGNKWMSLALFPVNLLWLPFGTESFSVVVAAVVAIDVVNLGHLDRRRSLWEDATEDRLEPVAFVGGTSKPNGDLTAEDLTEGIHRVSSYCSVVGEIGSSTCQPGKSIKVWLICCIASATFREKTSNGWKSLCVATHRCPTASNCNSYSRLIWRGNRFSAWLVLIHNNPPVEHWEDLLADGRKGSCTVCDCVCDDECCNEWFGCPIDRLKHARSCLWTDGRLWAWCRLTTPFDCPPSGWAAGELMPQPIRLTLPWPLFSNLDFNVERTEEKSFCLSYTNNSRQTNFNFLTEISSCFTFGSSNLSFFWWFAVRNAFSLHFRYKPASRRHYYRCRRRPITSVFSFSFRFDGGLAVWRAAFTIKLDFGVPLAFSLCLFVFLFSSPLPSVSFPKNSRLRNWVRFVDGILLKNEIRFLIFGFFDQSHLHLSFYFPLIADPWRQVARCHFASIWQCWLCLLPLLSTNFTFLHVHLQVCVCVLVFQ